MNDLLSHITHEELDAVQSEHLPEVADSHDVYLLNSNKLIYHIDRVREWVVEGKRIPPILIDIGATKICNIKCEFCYGIFQKSLGTARDIIPSHALVNLFYDAPRIGVKALVLTGDGEPTLNPAITQALQTGKDGGLDIGIATNGVALTEEIIKSMVRNCVWVRVNLSAASQAGYKLIHKADFFERVVDNVKKLVEEKKKTGSKVTIGLQMVMTPNGLTHVLKEAQLAVDLGVDYFVVKQCSDPIGDLPCSGFDIEGMIKASTPVLKEAEAMSTDKTKIIVKWNLLAVENRRAYPYCIDPPLIFQISGNSKCYPCGFLFNREEFEYGDLRQQRLPEIISSEHYWNVIDKIMKMHTKELCPLGCCRHDMTNLFLYHYIKHRSEVEKRASNLPEIAHRNFI